MENRRLSDGVDVVVIQTSESGYNRFCEFISEMDISQRVHVFRGFGFDELFSRLDASRKQLFITGTIRGSVQSAISLAEVLKKKYPLLTCLGYATDELSCPPFDECIIKPWASKESLGSVEKKLRNYIEGFLEGLN